MRARTQPLQTWEKRKIRRIKMNKEMMLSRVGHLRAGYLRAGYLRVGYLRAGYLRLKQYNHRMWMDSGVLTA
jgi:hypothetical protein